MALVTFDFDDTLLQTLWDEDWGSIEGGPNQSMLDALRAHAAAGDEVRIVTSRHEAFEGRPRRTAVAAFVQEHALPVTGIHFTNGKDKAETLKVLGSTKHFDDDPEELRLLPAGCEGVLVPVHPSWSKSCSPSGSGE